MHARASMPEAVVAPKLTAIQSFLGRNYHSKLGAKFVPQKSDVSGFR